MRKSISGPSNRSTLNGYNTHIEKHVFNKPFPLYPYALISRGEVILTGNYPKAKIKGSMWVEVTDLTGPAAKGMLWDGKQFKEPSDV